MNHRLNGASENKVRKYRRISERELERNTTHDFVIAE